MREYEPVPIADIYAARDRIVGQAIRTPLIRLNVDDAPAEIYLKLENLQPIGSFKVRGASNAVALAGEHQLSRGIWTASAGNMAQGVAWQAQRLGLGCTVVVPEVAPDAKRMAITRLGAKIVEVPVEEWLEVFSTRHFEGMDGLFVHAFSDPAVMAGNGTIGLEIIEDLPYVETVVIPWGGGGLACGIASAMRALEPGVKIYASEIAAMAPLATSLEAGKPTPVPYISTFVDGIGAPRVYPEMLALAQRLLDGSLLASVEAIAAAVRILVERNRIVAEGAGAVPLAAALAGLAGTGKVVCVISGGNIDADKLAQILSGETP